MFLNRKASRILLALAGFSAGCKQMPPSATTQQMAARAAPASTPAQTAAPQHETSLSNTPQVAQLAASPAEQPGVKDVGERKGPFTIKGQTFTVVQHLKEQEGGVTRPSRCLRLSTAGELSGIATTTPTLSSPVGSARRV